MMFNLHMKQYKNDTAHLRAHEWSLYSHKWRKTINKQNTQNLNPLNPSTLKKQQLTIHQTIFYALILFDACPIFWANFRRLGEWAFCGLV
jgi:hypothetical protein